MSQHYTKESLQYLAAIAIILSIYIMFTNGNSSALAALR